MKQNFFKLLPGAALLCFLFSSCQKNEAVTSHSSSQTSSPLTRTTTMIGAMDIQSDLEMSDVLANDQAPASDCPVVTFNPSKDVYPYIKTVDYGSGCTDAYGITTSGKRFTTVYADKNTAPAGKVISVTTFGNYYVNGVSVSGDVKVTVVNSAMSGPLVLRIAVNKSVSDAFGNTSSFVDLAIQKQIAGIGTDSTGDDVYQISENAYGTEVSGDSAMVTWNSVSDPANPVIKAESCEFRSQGALKITLKQLGVQTDEYLDYGNGDCDNNATLTVNNGEPQPITLPFYFFAGAL